jgi:hypothetical protein
VAAVTAEQAREAHAAGRAAALALQPSTNPHAVDVPTPWRQPRTTAGRAALAVRVREAALLARAWRLGYSAGQADYARARGLVPASAD